MKKLCLIAVLAVSTAVQAEIAIIVHPSNAAALNADVVSKLFLGREKSFPGGATAVPLSLAEGSAAAGEFNDKVLKKSFSQLKAYWSKLLFTGKGTPPKEVTSDAEMLQLVANNPNMIGYVDAKSVDSTVKVVLKL